MPAAPWTTVERGDAVGRLTIPRLGLRVYVAGRRTADGAPFSDVDQLRRGNTLTMEMPYAPFTDRVTGRRIVPATFLKALESRGSEEIALRACPPRFSAGHRIITWPASSDG